MLFLMVFFIGIQLIIGIGIGVIQAAGITTAMFGTLWFAIAIQLASLLLPLFIWLAITGDSFKRHMPSQPLGGVNILLIVVFSIFVQPTMMLISAFFSLFFVNDAAEIFTHFAAQPWWLIMLAIAVTPGVVEELVFRGYIQSNQKSSAFWKIAVMNGFLFGLMHLSPHQFLYTFVLGVVFAYLVYFTRSIWAGILSHFIVNGSQVSLAHWATGAADGMDAYAAEVTFAQTLYDSFVETDPEMAQRMYDWAYGITPEIIAIIGVGILVVITLPIAVALFVAMRNHNIRRNAAMAVTNEPVDVAAEEVSAEIEEITMAEIAENEEFRPVWSKVDWYLVGVVAIYVVFIVLI